MDYILLIEKVRARVAETGLDFGVDMPFWFDREPLSWGPPGKHNYRLSDAVIERADNVSILAYRTHVHGPNGVLELVGYLLWRCQLIGRELYVGVDTSAAGGDDSFFDESEADFIEAVRLIDQALGTARRFRGVAIHSYESLRDLHRPQISR
jgi:hypothetical protein